MQCGVDHLSLRLESSVSCVTQETNDVRRTLTQDVGRTCFYQLAFLTPGIIPESASSLKQILHSPKRRMNARDRPHRLQRLFCRTLNFGFCFAFSSNDFGGISASCPRLS